MSYQENVPVSSMNEQNYQDKPQSKSPAYGEMQENQYYYQQPRYYAPNIKPQRFYNHTDRNFSVIAFILGFTALKALLNVDYGFGLLTSLFFLVLTFFNYFYCKKSGMNISRESKFLFTVSIILSILFAITDNESVKSINFCIVTVTNLYFVYSTYRSDSDSIMLNAFKAVVMSPFYEYGSSFGALFHKTTAEDKSKTDKKTANILPIIMGLILSIPVTLVATIVLVSSDDNFGWIYRKLLDWFLDDMFSNIMIFLFSIPIGMYIFSAVYSRAYRKANKEKLTDVPKMKFRIFPATTCNAFLTPLCVLYFLYIFTQISYFFKTLGTVTETFDYSEYARNGFFELCFIAVLNLAVASLVMFFVKLDKKKLPVSVRIFVAIFSVLTLCLILTALAKMIMYIDFYGMTPLRVNTSVFMVYMFVLFVVLIVKQFRFKISFTKIAYVLAVFVIIAMSLLPVDLFIADYNINAYKNGKTWMGRDAIYQLDSSALSSFIEFRKNNNEFTNDDATDNNVNSQIDNYLRDTLGDFGEIDIYNFNLTRYIALLTLNDYYLS